MNHIRQTLHYAGMAYVAAMCFSATAWSQGFDEPPAKQKPHKPAAGKAAGGEKAGKPVNLGPREDPVITALLSSAPTTPSDIFRTAQLLVEAGRPELAKGYLKKLLDTKLDDAQWSALVEEYHTQAFTDLANRSELRPESEELIAAALGAVKRRLNDPARLAEEIKQLQDPSEDVRARAMARLRGAHGTAASALIAVLGDPQREAEHPAVRSALAFMRGDAIDPLADIIERADTELTIEAIKALAEMRANEAIVYLFVPALAEESDVQVRAPAREAIAELMGRVPSKAEAAQQLFALARSYFAGKQTVRTEIDGRVTMWSWNPATKQCTPRNCSPDDAARAITARLARAARALAPDDRRIQVLDLAAGLEQIVYDRGLDRRLDFKNPAVRDIAALDPQTIDAVLAFCLAERHPSAARAAAEILGRTGKAETLLQGGIEPSPLARVLRGPDRRLRMAALDAIVNLQPRSPFTGSSYVLDAAVSLAASTGGRRALIVSPSTETLEEWEGVLKFHNIAVDPVASGRAALRMAFRCPDYELVVIDMATRGPPAEEIVQQLRQDYRTTSLRVALVARAGFLQRAARIAEQDPLAMAFSRPFDAEAARWQFGQLAALATPEFVGFSEREALAVRALDCLARLGDMSCELYDMRRAEDAALAGLAVPRLSGHAVPVLANIGTQTSQQALVDVASRLVNPLAIRRAAGIAFRSSVKRFGLLLGQEAVREQYARYNQSASRDVATQQVLAAILRAIEARATPAFLAAAKKGAAPVKPAPPKGSGKTEKPAPAR